MDLRLILVLLGISAIGICKVAASSDVDIEWTVELEFEDDVYDECGLSRKCFGLPLDCVDTKDCTSLLSYGAANGSSYIPVDLYGDAARPQDKDSFWIGFGISMQGKMAETAVIQCAQYSNRSSDVVAAYNPEKHQYLPLSNKYNGITNVTTTLVDGYIRCSFNLDVKRNINSFAYDLTKPYFVLLGTGSIDRITGDLKGHHKKPHKVADHQVLACGNDCQTSLTDATTNASTTSDPTTTGAPLPVSSGFFGYPQGCVQNKNCKMSISYGLSATNSSRVALTLRGEPNVTTANQFWVAVGLAPESTMDFSFVMECVAWMNGTNHVQSMFLSYNDGNHHNTRLMNGGLYPVKTSVDNGALECVFESDLLHTLGDSVVPPGHSPLFNLSLPNYLLLASGPLKSGNEKSRHTSKLPATAPSILTNGGIVSNGIYDACGLSRKCFGIPAGCVDSKTCVSLLSYGATEGSDSIPIDLYGMAATPADDSSFWIGFGLSEGGNMEKTAVIQCAHFFNSSDDVIAAYNPPVTKTDDHVYMPLADKHDGITEDSTSYADGYIQCSFNLAVQRNVSNVTYDLSTPYFILLGSGWINQTTDELMWHRSKPSVVASHQVLACGNQCQPATCVNGKCFGVPRDCEQNGQCSLLVSWSTIPGNDDVVQMSLTGGPPNSSFADNFWIGFGLTPGDVGNKMSNAAVVQCAHYPNGVNALVAAYNLPVVAPAADRYSFEILDERSYGISSELVGFVDGRLNCSFRLDIQRTINGSGFSLKDYLYIMAGSGWVQTLNATNSYKHRKHVHIPLVSSQPVALSCQTNNCTKPLPPSKAGTYGYPADCVANNNCKMLATFGLSKTNTSRVAITLSGVPDAGSDGQFWVALGLAPQSDMDFSYVMECVTWKNGTIESRDVFASYNDGKHVNTRIVKEGLYLNRSSYDNGMLECVFETDMVHNVTGGVVPAGHNATFDLAQPHYLLLALGPLSTGNEKKHHTSKASSLIMVDLTQGGDVPDANPQVTMKKAHAIVMVVAWNMLVAIGIIMARQTKDMWPKTKPFGLQMWFIIHRLVMVSAVTLSIAGVVIIFVDSAEWRNIPHAYVGIITFGLALIQPFIALFRPHPGTPNRPIFNYFHWTVGYLTYLMSVATMFLGTKLSALGVNESAGYILIGSFVANFLIHLVVDVYRYSQKTTMLNDSESKQTLETPTETTTVVEETSTVVTEPLRHDDKVRQSLLALDGLLVTGATVAVVVLIAIA